MQLATRFLLASAALATVFTALEYPNLQFSPDEWSTYSEGVRAGTITKIAQADAAEKATTVEMTMLNAKGEGISNTFTFSVSTGSPLLEKLQAMHDSGHCIKLQYEEKLAGTFLEGNTNYDITGAKDMGAACGQKAPVPSL